MTDQLTVHQAVARIIKEMPAVPKGQENKEQGYKFRGIDDVLAVARPLLGKHGVVIVPSVVERLYATRTTRNGYVQHEVNLHVRYTIYGPTGDQIDASTWGEGTDSGDKATNKAMTAAFKYLLFQLLAVGGDADSDHSTPERSVAAVPAPTKAAVQAVAESVKSQPESVRDAVKARMAEANLSFTKGLSQLDLDTITDWVTELSETAGEGATSVAVESAPSPVQPSDDGVPRRTSASEPTPTPSSEPSGGGDAVGEVGVTPAGDDPAALLALEETRALIARFNALELEPKAAALGFKRSLGISDWFAADPDALGKLKAKVTELEGVAS